MNPVTIFVFAFLFVLIISLASIFVWKRMQFNQINKSHNNVPANTQLYSPTPEELATAQKMQNQSPEEFKSNLVAIENNYPFDNWYEVNFKEHEMEVYTKENCDKASAIFDKLQKALIEIGPDANEDEKLSKFKTATFQLNDLNNVTDDGLIETGEREDLCEIIDQMGIVCGLIPNNYADEDGIASLWREW